jgi:hypothetical protein
MESRASAPGFRLLHSSVLIQLNHFSADLLPRSTPSARRKPKVFFSGVNLTSNSSVLIKNIGHNI